MKKSIIAVVAVWCVSMLAGAFAEETAASAAKEVTAPAVEDAAAEVADVAAPAVEAAKTDEPKVEAPAAEAAKAVESELAAPAVEETKKAEGEVAVPAAEETKTAEPEAVAPQSVTITGIVMVFNDAQGAVKKIKVLAETGKAYLIKLDSNGKKLAAMKSKKMAVTGSVSEEEMEGQAIKSSWMTVETFEPAATDDAEMK